MKPIEGYEEFYDVTDTGEVFSKITNKFLKQSIDRYGYPNVGLVRDKIQTPKRVHRLVAKAFIPNPNQLPQVNHKDENRANNNVDNLEWCDNSYNVNYGTRNKRVAEKMRFHPNILRRKIVCIDEPNCKVTIFPSLAITKDYGFCVQSVWQVCHHINKTHRGCKFMYYEDWIRGDDQ